MHVIVDCIGLPLSIFFLPSHFPFSSLFFYFPTLTLFCRGLFQTVTAFSLNKLEAVAGDKRVEKQKSWRSFVGSFLTSISPLGRVYTLSGLQEIQGDCSWSLSIPQAHSLLLASSRTFITITWILFSKGECWTMESSTHLASTQLLN